MIDYTPLSRTEGTNSKVVVSKVWIPAFAGMTNAGGGTRNFRLELAERKGIIAVNLQTSNDRDR